MLPQKQILKLRKIFSNTNHGSEQQMIFKILGDDNRYRIFELLTKQQHLTVSDVAKILKISIPLASQHVKSMFLANMIKKDRRGQKIDFYLVRTNPIIESIIKEIL